MEIERSSRANTKSMKGYLKQRRNAKELRSYLKQNVMACEDTKSESQSPK